MYINTHTYYSLRYGTIPTDELLKISMSMGIKTLALTDINTTSACMDFVRLSRRHGIKPVLGVDFRNGARQQFIMLARDNHGFQLINTYLSHFLHEDKLIIPDRAVLLENTFVIYPFWENQSITLADNEYLGVSPGDLNKLKFLKTTIDWKKLVILHTVSFRHKKDFNTHRLLRAIDNNVLLSKLPIEAQGKEQDTLMPPASLAALYGGFPEIVKNTEDLLAKCAITFDFSENEPNNQKSYTGNEEMDFKLMKKLCYSGLPYRYKNPGNRIFSRLEKELMIIKEKGFVSYFLINWKILKYARSKGYFYVGRGSGANSIAAYLLRITDVDPVELDLYFERFINLYRKNPPDFDIDFSWKDRDDITTFIFKRFPNTALLAVYNTFQYKAAVREMGKVFGIPKHELDVLSTGRYVFDQLDKLSQLVIRYAKAIEGFPNYLGIHAGGIIISEQPIQHYCATFLPPKGYATTQFDMVVAEDIGLYKFDILSQRGLGKIKDAVNIVHKNYPNQEPIDIHDIKRFKKDEKIKSLLRNAKAIGCFYVESPAMRMLLKKLQVDNYLGLVAASSVIRPGVAKSGMMRQYILRYRYPDRRKDAHPILLNIMPETYGVMVYQEDVIKVAHYFGGLTLGEADMLRRGMSGKFRSRDEFLKVKKRFFDNCHEKGHSAALTAEIWRQIESFAGYAFAKGHSASYAVESYQSLFLKAYFPIEYMVATLNNFGGFYRIELYVHEARMHGAIIEAPCINTSQKEAIVNGKTIYLGFMFVQSLESQAIEQIRAERASNGVFQDLDDFIARVPISLEQITILIKINAFRFTHRNKRELLWEAHMKINKITIAPPTIDLFKKERVNRKPFTIPKLTIEPLEDAFDEIEHIGFPLCNPFDLLKDKPSHYISAQELAGNIGKQASIMGYLVTTKNTKTSKGDRMQFGTFLDYYGHFIDTVHFPQTAATHPFRGGGIYLITGKVIEEFDCINLEVTEMKHMPIVEDPRYADPPRKVYVDGMPSQEKNNSLKDSDIRKTSTTNYKQLIK